MSDSSPVPITSPRALHNEYDEAAKKREEETVNVLCSTNEKEQEIKEFQLVHENGEIHNIVIREDGYVNATMLCKANKKNIGHYLENKNTNAFIDSLSTVIGIPITELVSIKQGGDPKLQGTWVHRKIAYHLAMWVHPPFAVSVSNWLDELLTKGSVRIERPLLPILDRTEMDAEAEALESTCDFSLNTNNPSLYMAYVGDGLVKIGYSSCFLRRESKHLSCESSFPHFRILRVSEISGQDIETQVHALLDRYRAVYHKHKEVYRPSASLADFIRNVENLLQENDLRLQLSRAREEIMRLRLANAELELRILKGTEDLA